MENQDTKTIDKNKTKTNYIYQYLYICIAILIISLLYGIAINKMTLAHNEARGTFGDMFGGLNAIFSGFAFAGVIITIIMQMKELEETRKEMARSTSAQNASQLALNEQLSTMEQSAKLEAIKKYIESHSTVNDKDQREIALRIQRELTEEIFFEDKYLDIVKPQLSISKSAHFYRTKSNAHNPNKVVLIEIANGGASCEINANVLSEVSQQVNIRMTKPKILPNSTTSHPDMGATDEFERNTNVQLRINNITTEKSIRILLATKGKLVKHCWEKVLDINIPHKGNTFTETLGVDKLVRRDPRSKRLKD